MTSWTVSNPLESALKETENPIVFQGPKTKSREELDFQFGGEKVASARRAYEGITTAVNDSSFLRKMYELGSPSLARAEICRTHVPGDDLDKQGYLREYINAKVAAWEAPALYLGRMSTIREKLAEVGITKPDQEANLHVLQCLSSRCGLCSNMHLVQRSSSPENAMAYIGDDTPLVVEYVGNLDLVFHSGKDVRVTLESVSYVPAMSVNSLSLNTVQANQNITFDVTGVPLLGGCLTFPKDRAGSRLNANAPQPPHPPMPYA